MSKTGKWLVLLFMLFQAITFANNDSLLAIYKNPNNSDSIRLKSIERLVNKLLYVKPDSAFQLGKMQLELAKKANNTSFQISALGNMGITKAITQNFEEALSIFYRQLSLAEMEVNTSQVINTVNNIGIVYNMMGNYYKAIDLYKKSLKMATEEKDSIAIANALNNIGNIYNNLGEEEQALDYHSKCLFIRKLVGDKKGLAHSYINLSNLLKSKENFDKALEYGKNALKIKREINDLHGTAIALTTIGAVYYAQENYKESEKYLSEALEISKSVNDKSSVASIQQQIAMIKYYNNQYKEAEQLSLSAYQLANEINKPQLISECSNGLSLIYTELLDYKKAYLYLRKHLELAKKIEEESRASEIIMQEKKLEYEKEKELTAQSYLLKFEREQDRVAIEKRQQQLILLFVSLFLILFIVFSVFIYNRFKLTQKQKQIIEYQKQEVDEKNKEILDSIKYAKRIQGSIFPPSRIFKEAFKEGFVLYEPKDIVAGDFYWMSNIKDTVFFTVADCTGHGVPGALLSVVCSNVINKVVNELNQNKPDVILNQITELLEEKFSTGEVDIQDGMDISFCSYHKKTKELQYAGANNSIYIIRSGELTELKPDKQPIGKFSNRKPFTNHKIQLIENDCIYLFTDGFADQFGGEKGKKFKYSRFKEKLIEIHTQPMSSQLAELSKTFALWKANTEQIDDVCIMGVKV